MIHQNDMTTSYTITTTHTLLRTPPVAIGNHIHAHIPTTQTTAATTTPAPKLAARSPFDHRPPLLEQASPLTDAEAPVPLATRLPLLTVGVPRTLLLPTLVVFTTTTGPSGEDTELKLLVGCKGKYLLQYLRTCWHLPTQSDANVHKRIAPPPACEKASSEVTRASVLRL